MWPTLAPHLSLSRISNIHFDAPAPQFASALRNGTSCVRSGPRSCRFAHAAPPQPKSIAPAALGEWADSISVDEIPVAHTHTQADQKSTICSLLLCVCVCVRRPHFWFAIECARPCDILFLPLLARSIIWKTLQRARYVLPKDGLVARKQACRWVYFLTSFNY